MADPVSDPMMSLFSAGGAAVLAIMMEAFGKASPVGRLAACLSIARRALAVQILQRWAQRLRIWPQLPCASILGAAGARAVEDGLLDLMMQSDEKGSDKISGW